MGGAASGAEGAGLGHVQDVWLAKHAEVRGKEAREEYAPAGEPKLLAAVQALGRRRRRVSGRSEVRGPVEVRGRMHGFSTRALGAVRQAPEERARKALCQERGAHRGIAAAGRGRALALPLKRRGLPRDDAVPRAAGRTGGRSTCVSGRTLAPCVSVGLRSLFPSRVRVGGLGHSCRRVLGRLGVLLRAGRLARWDRCSQLVDR